MTCRKIKKFKINIRKIEVLRKLKKINLDPNDLFITNMVNDLSDEIMSHIETGALYKTVINQDKNFYATSFWLATIGKKVEEWLKQFKDDSYESKIIPVLCEEALEQVNNFIYRLILDESEKEKYTLSDRISISDLNELREVCNMLEINKLNVEINPSGFIPKYSCVNKVIWYPQKRIHKR